MSAPDHQLRLQADGDDVPSAAGSSFFGARMHLFVLAVGLVLLLGVYHETVASLVRIWNRSDTFAHGFLVAPISCWLIWRERAQLRDVPIAPSLLGVLAGLLAGFAWLLGELASADSLSQFALVGMVISLVWAVMGTRLARAIAFPLGFLFFLVPFGEFLFPSMMDWTAHFVIGGLQLFGVPVFAEGRTLIIPSGHWSIVEGCSGVRYLIASVVVGSLYAYLTYRSLRRRLVFVALSVGLPVLANWIRAWGIVMLGHFSGNRIATGVDHVIYGWVFFGVVVLGLFWVGGRWREDDSPQHSMSGKTEAAIASGRGGACRYLGASTIALAAMLVWQFVPGMLEVRGGNEAVTFPSMPERGTWVSSTARITSWAPRYAGMRGDYRGAWVSGDRDVGVYLAYYHHQAPGTELINSENRILRNKDPDWTMASYGTRDVSIEHETVEARSTEIFNQQRRLLVWSWYWVDGHWTSNDYVAKLYQVASKLSGRGDDSAAVMIFAPVQDDGRESAERALTAFAQEMGRGIVDVLTQVREASHGR